MESFKVRKPPLPLDTNSAPARTLASTEAKDSSGSDHRQVGQFRKRCHSRPGRPVIPEPRGVRRLLRRRVAVIGLDESDGNTWLDPFRSSLRNKASGAVCRSEPAFGNRVLDPNVFAHSSGVGLGGIAGMPARELRNGGRNLSEVALCARLPNRAVNGQGRKFKFRLLPLEYYIRRLRSSCTGDPEIYFAPSRIFTSSTLVTTAVRAPACRHCSSRFSCSGVAFSPGRFTSS